MALVRAFRAWVPRADAAARVAAVPYDVVSAAEAARLAEGNPDSLLHVTRPEIDLPSGTDEHEDVVYAQARCALDALRARGVLVREAVPCLYVYRLVMTRGAGSAGEAHDRDLAQRDPAFPRERAQRATEGIVTHTQTGIAAAFSVDEYDAGTIVKHELTRPDKEEDRTRHVVALACQAEPVFLTYRPDPDLDALLRRTVEGPPLFDFVAPDGVAHTVWRVDRPAPFAQAFARVPRIYIADGHHRSAAASNVLRQRTACAPVPQDDPCRSFLAVAFPTDQVQVLPYNRLVKDLRGRTPDAFLAALRGAGVPVEPAAGAVPERPGDVRALVGGRWYRLTLVPSSEDPVARLDVQMLQDRVLAPLLEIADPRTDRRIAFVGGIRGTGELEERVRRGEAAAAFSLHAVTPEQLLAVADAGRIMPPKSTWFEPKLRSGLFLHEL